jgi:two-component system cell cycle sensor histidine kinase/response regulator CckA
VVISVADTGIGMDQETMAHIFEPFFTTKLAGKGTGLGLATCYGIVKQANGYIRVTSVQHRGTTFRVFLPRSVTPIAADAMTPAPTPNETVLLVEDEYQVRRLIERALQQEGYEIITASNGAEAVAIQRQHEGQIHLLITDVVMPEMGGRECARLIRADRPDIRVVYMSGYSEELTNLQAELTETAAFIAKPFSPAELRRLVRELLDVLPV